MIYTIDISANGAEVTGVAVKNPFTGASLLVPIAREGTLEDAVEGSLQNVEFLTGFKPEEASFIHVRVKDSDKFGLATVFPSKHEVLRAWWNGRAEEIEKIIRESTDPKDDFFHWSQLVWQELEMWCSLGKTVDYENFNFICNRRGFNNTQRDFLHEGLKQLRIWRDPFDQEIDAEAHVMTVEEFYKSVFAGAFNDYDGSGAASDGFKQTSGDFYPSTPIANLPYGTTHIVWFNK